jgi:hypothetical protein
VESIQEHIPRSDLDAEPRPEAEESARDALASPRGAPDATGPGLAGDPIGALSRAQESQLEAREGLELRHWASSTTG